MNIQIDIKSCIECPFIEVGPNQSTDGFDSGNDWKCTKAQRMIRSFVEWHEVNKTPIPNWCPFNLTTTTK